MARRPVRAPAGSQAYALGSALGLQFHPEASPEILRRWVEEGQSSLDANGVDGAAFLAEAEARAEETRARADLVVTAFLGGRLAT